MKTKSLLGALLLFVTSVLVAAPGRNVLVAGKNCRIENGKAIFTGSVSLIFKDPSETITVSADEIVFDQISSREGGVSLLRCSGDTVIESGGRTTRGKDLTFEFADMKGNVYLLNSNGVLLSGTTLMQASGSQAWPKTQAGSSLPTFDTVSPKRIETQLRRIPVVSPLRDYAPGFTPHP